MKDLFISVQEFLQNYQLDCYQLMWFLGAGASRSANLPTASDLTWDLKKRAYCTAENQPYDSYDLNSGAVKKLIQSYMESKGYPELWSPEEYSFYFELLFKNDYQKQQRYIESALKSERVSLTVGHRILASLVRMNMIKVLFTTNFDDVVEQAFAKVNGRNLSVFNIEGSYAALDALNSEAFPIYVKLHGDFKYRSIKNLSEDLLVNDSELKRCFLSSASRFGMIVSGYSGRDSNVMGMMRDALNSVNPFPKGIYWAVINANNAEATAIDFIQEARSKGIKAYFVEAGTYDEFLSKIWRQVPNIPSDLVKIVRLQSQSKVSIPLPPPGINTPILRTNMLQLDSLKLRCGVFRTEQKFTFTDLIENAKQLPYKVKFTLTDEILYWGNKVDAIKIIPHYRQLIVEETYKEIEAKELEIGAIKGFVEEGIIEEIAKRNPSLSLRKAGKSFYLVVKEKHASEPEFQSLKQAVGYNKPEEIFGALGRGDVSWCECVEIGLQVNASNIYLYLKPDIWIKPRTERENHVDFLRNRKSKRYNAKSYQILDAWITILFGGTKRSIKFSNPESEDYAPEFLITTRTAFSRRG